MAAVISVRQVRVVRDGKAVLNVRSLDVLPGDRIALIGPNGAGKSTLVGVISGLVRPTVGHVFIDAEPVASLSRREIAQRVAVVAQAQPVPLGFSVRDVVAMGRAPFQGWALRMSADDRRIVDEVLKEAHLTAFAARRCDTLSFGEWQRVCVARALAQAERVLLLDEPTAHLDIGETERLFALLTHALDTRHLTCMAVLHDIDLAMRWGRRILLLDRGDLVFDGPPHALNAAMLSRAFGLQLASAEAAQGQPSCGVDSPAKASW